MSREHHRPERWIGGTFPEDTHWNAEQQAVEFGLEIGEYRGIVRVQPRVPTPTIGAAHAGAVRRGVLPSTDPVREHRRGEAAPAPVDRGRECRDQRAGLTLHELRTPWSRPATATSMILDAGRSSGSRRGQAQSARVLRRTVRERCRQGLKHGGSGN